MPRPVRILVLVVAALFLSSAGALFALRNRASAPDPVLPDQEIGALVIPDFTMTDQRGTPITNSVFAGRVTVVDFIFTHCPFVCPTLSSKMREAARRLEGTGVRFLSISVDPARDTPAVLAEYARRNDADPARWTFATGDQATVKRIVADGLKFALYEQADRPIVLADGSKMSNIVHPPFFVLVGPEGGVLAVYPVTTTPETLDELVRRARAVDRTLKH